ncbi:MAG TPA: CHAT domain-containing protein, partial [Acidimicrobiales bacterium]
AVDHSSFWTDQRTVHQLRAWLRADWPINVPAAVPSEESDPLAETALPPDPLSIGRVIKAATGIPARLRKAAEELVGGPLDSEAIPPTDERDAVVVVPGIMGTHLARPDGTVVWLDPLRLARGHFADMALPGKETAAFTPAGLNRCYLPLVLRLAKTHDVYVAPYDWRLDIKESACALGRTVETVLDRNPNRVHLVAHSMGGLVARAMVSFEEEVWKAMAAANRPAGSGRLVMLGTPHHGSFSIVLTLLGQETVLKVLAGVDGFNSSEELSAVVATFPGIDQMLPHTTAHCDGDDHKDLFDAATWGARSPVSQDLLTKAEEFHARLARARDPKRMVCVAGYGNATPYRVTIREPGRFSLGVSSRGDGRVAERLARLEGVKTYYTPASHGGLPAAKDVLGVLDDLLELGRTTGLPDSPPSVRGVDALATPPLVPAELFDEIHAADALRDGAGSEGAPPDWRAAEARLEEGLAFLVGGGRRRPSKVQIEVRVKHASLEQAEFPVAVGHYAGLPQGGAERFLDTRLAGALRARQIVGQYPEGPGAAIYIAAPEGHRPRGAIVLGLGSFGQLTPGTLAEAMCNGVVAYALADREIRDPSVGQEWSIGVSSVLVSTPGRHGLSVESSVAGLVEGVVTAAGRLRKLNSGPRLERVILEVVELYEEPAEDAALAVVALPDLLDPRVLQEADVLAATRLATGDGRRAGSPPKDLTGTPWVPIRIEMDEPRGPSRGIRRMRFSPLARRAQANAIEHDVNTTMIQAFIEEAIHRADVNHDFSRTLYHHLFPHRAKLDFDRAEALHLLVDEDVADIPWELLATESAGGCVSPLALRSGLLRQLVSSRQTRERWRQPSGQLALIVGDPPTALDRLPGAREEAHELTSLFHQYDWTVEPLIYGPSDDGSRGEWMDILNRLYANSYRIVHIAAHGVFDDDPRRAGVQIGLGDDHRITPLCFDDMMVTPDLVFLNCCHLAQMAPGNTAPGLDRPNQLAATVARQLLENGVPAVVVAGWAVDDVAARAFASKLYRSMLDGVPFGDAVRRARIAARDADRGATTTWGAYQCYGDPDFQFFAHDPPEPVPRIVSASQLARQLDMAAARAGNAMTDVHKARVLQEVQDLVQHAGVDLLTDGAVLEALGHAYAELGEHRSAID